MLNSSVKNIIEKDNRILKVILESGKEISGDYFIFATGGLSYPQTGSTGEGLSFSRKLGHKIVEPKPALVPIEVKEEWIKELQRSEEHTSELQSRQYLVCRLLLEKKKKT